MTLVEFFGSSDFGYTDSFEVPCARCGAIFEPGAAYVHWGDSTCPEGNKFQYAGFIMGSQDVASSGAQYACVHFDVRLGKVSASDQHGTQNNIL
eukprot:SAG11_NODE_32595_length_282_cov_0.989071_1_plen_93_part_11